MAKKGEIITNKITGETITWLATAQDTNGQYLAMDLKVQPLGLAAVNHIHPDQDEYFLIKKGTIKMQLGSETKMLNAGDRIVVPKGIPHQWWNPSTTDNLEMELTFKPALTTEIFFEQFFGLCNDNKNNPDGSFPFWRAIAGLNYYNIFRSDAPLLVQKFLGYTLGPVARLLGYRAVNPKYSTVI